MYMYIPGTYNHPVSSSNVSLIDGQVCAVQVEKGQGVVFSSQLKQPGDRLCVNIQALQVCTYISVHGTIRL